MKKWSDLNIKDKSLIMRDYIRNGITDLKDIRRRYDTGGDKSTVIADNVTGEDILNGGLKGAYFNGPTDAGKEFPQQQVAQTPDFTGIKTTGNRPYNADYLNHAYSRLRESDLTRNQIAETLGTWIEESGLNPYAVSPDGKFLGLNQWSYGRYPLQMIDNPTQQQIYDEMDRQIDSYLKSVRNTTDRMSWTHGGTGSGYNRGSDAYEIWNNPKSSLEDSFRAHSFGYTRPSGRENSYNNRLKVVQQVLDRMPEFSYGGFMYDLSI